MQGDRMIVVSGDLKNLIGRVERVADDGKVDIMPKMEGLTDILTFDVSQLEKYFEVSPNWTATLNGPSPPDCHVPHSIGSLGLCIVTIRARVIEKISHLH